MKFIDGIPVWGPPDEGALTQIKVCKQTAAKASRSGSVARTTSMSDCLCVGPVFPSDSLGVFPCGSPALGVIVYFIAAFVIARKVRIDLPLCRAHRSWRARMNIAGASLLIQFL